MHLRLVSKVLYENKRFYEDLHPLKDIFIPN